jgi:hypothetical protein
MTLSRPRTGACTKARKRGAHCSIERIDANEQRNGEESDQPCEACLSKFEKFTDEGQEILSRQTLVRTVRASLPAMEETSNHFDKIRESFAILRGETQAVTQTQFK